MELMKGLYSGFKDWYGTLNPATLSGAIDVIVVQQPDGSLACSPFHVRFGKMGVLRSTEKLVDIEINGQPVENLYMKLGDSGEAFFVESTEEEETLPANLATSPLPSEMSLMEEGIRRLHAGELLREKQNQRSREELIDGKTDNSLKRSQEDVDRVLKCIKEPCTEEDMKELQKLGGRVEVTVETEVGKGKNKRQLKLTGSLKGVEDTDSQSSLDDKDSKFRTQVSDDSVKSPRQSSRTKLRKKRKRQLKGTTASLTGVDSKQTWRQASFSDSDGSVSSSDELDSGGLFHMDEDFNSPRVPTVWTYGRSDQLPVSDELAPEDWSSLSLRPSERIFHVFSEGDVTPLISPEATRPPTPKSDTELETNRPYHSSLKKGSISDNEKIEWNWGELPECTVPAEESPVLPEVIESSPTSKNKQPTTQPPSNDSTKAENEKDKKWLWQRLSFRRGPQSGDTQEGMYLDDLASEGIDPEVYALYFPERRLRTISQEIRDEDKSSDLGASLPHSPNTVESGCESPPNLDDLRFCDIQMSLCGGLKVEDNEVPMDKFNEHIISFDKFSSDPIILSNPNLVVRIGSKFYTWQVAGPILMSLLAFQRPLPDSTVSSLVKDNTKGEGRRSFTDWLWPRNYSKAESPQPVKEEAVDEAEEKSGETSKADVVLEMDGMEKTETTDSKDQNSADGTEGSSIEKQDSQDDQQVHPERFKKTIRLSSDELQKLNLKPGPNNVCFSVTTRYQGTAMCQATIYLWRHDSKVIISDVDGTITKSDVFGQILPVIGKDWTHSGVAKLFDGVRKNGYEFIYLSARAIGQSKVTKAYLKGVCQDSLSLPDGPLLLNPSSLLRALHREVIIKKPEEFKIRCLKDIQSLFSGQESKGSPFYAGFGNRINDTWAYHAVGIPSSRIFTINPQGKVTHEFTKSFQTSYPHLRNLTDQLFPPIDRRDRVTLVEPDQYSHFTYWRQPLPSIDVNSLLKKEEKTS